jgi:hypothetical protein
MSRYLLVVMLVACGSSTPPPTPVAKPVAPKPAGTEADANAAYDAKQWSRCAEIYEALAQERTGKKREDAIYNAACCRAQGNEPDRAFALLEGAAKDGMKTSGHMKQDTDLVPLHADARWAALLAKLEQNVVDWEAKLGDAALRREILAMVDEDQKARFAWVAKPEDPTMRTTVQDIDKKTTARMKEIVAKSGWPTKKLVGDDGSHGAWLLVQHADQDVAFQKQCLALLETAVAANDADPKNFAYLFDRVAVNEKRKQRWGTQFGPNGEPQPIEDEANVDARRKQIGLNTMAEYRLDMKRTYKK